MIQFVLPSQPPQAVHVRRGSSRTEVENGLVRLEIDTRTGRYSLIWKGRSEIQGLYGEVKLVDQRLLKTTAFTSHTIGPNDIVRVKDSIGTGVRVVEHHCRVGGPELRSVFWVYRNRPEAIVQIQLGVGATNYLVPIAVDSPIVVRHSGPLQSLYVPFDNDMYSRYSSRAWTHKDLTSHEVGAVYDDTTRHGLVVGSIDHNTWKSGVTFQLDSKGNLAALWAAAGVTSEFTHDVEAHGFLSGTNVESPRMSIGCYSDWRVGLERFGDLNRAVKPPLPWSDGVPFGWNSWSGYKDKVSAADALAATDFVHDALPNLRSRGTAYVNLDSYWDNLSDSERSAFVAHAHTLGLKAGIYFTPFVGWGDLRDKVAGTAYTYRDLVLKDRKGEPLPKLSGGWPLDPTHPGTLARLDRQLQEFARLGIDFVKFDFMSHGALEGKHFDSSVHTGLEAYTKGLRRIDEDLSLQRTGNRIFISFSIAPLFPQGFAHSRRISCDAFANIGSTEYLMNSASYGWWTAGRLYCYNDPDSSCVYQPLGERADTLEEGRTRLNASIVSGGMIIDGDRLNDPLAAKRVSDLYSNTELLELAKRTLPFRPTWGASGDKACNVFNWVSPNGDEAYVAVFNYSSSGELDVRAPLDRIGLSRDKWVAKDLWSKKVSPVRSALSFRLGVTESTIVHLSRVR